MGKVFIMSVNRKSLVIRMHPDLHQRVKYWSERDGAESMNEWIQEAIEQRIARANGDYDLPTAEVARLNQLIDGYEAMARNMESLEKVILTMSDSMISMARGDSYLLDADDGELSH